MSNPLEDFLGDHGPVEKTAFGFGQARGAAGEVGRGVLGGMGALAAAGAVTGVGIAASKIYGAATKSRDFKKMLEFNPDLQEHHARDPKVFNQMFSSLRSMNPKFSSDPLVAGTYLRRMVENPMTAGGILTESVGDRDKFRSPFEGAVEQGASFAAKHYGEKSEKPKLPGPHVPVAGK